MSMHFKARLFDLIHAAHIVDIGDTEYHSLVEDADENDEPLLCLAIDDLYRKMPQFAFYDQEVEVNRELGTCEARDNDDKLHTLRFVMIRPITLADLSDS